MGLGVAAKSTGENARPPVIGPGRPAALGPEARGLLLDERVGVDLRDVLKKRAHARVVDLAERLQDLQAQLPLRLGLLVGLEQAGQGLGRSPDAERPRRREARLGVLEHLEQLRQRPLVSDLGQCQGGPVAQPPIVSGEKLHAVRDGLGRADGDGDRDSQRLLGRVGGIGLVEESADELRPQLPERIDGAVLAGP